MDLSLELMLGLALVAMIAGFVDAIAGGGGMLTVPALLAVGVPPVQALATNKLQGCFASGSASLYFVRSRLISPRAVLLPGIGTAVGAWAGAAVVTRVDATQLMGVIPGLLLMLGVYFLLAPGGTMANQERAEPRLWLMPVVGVMVGFYDGFFGPGAGALYTAGFSALVGFGLVRATANAKVFNFASNLAALMSFLSAGLIVWQLGLLMALGGLIGARMGAGLVVCRGAKLVRPMVIGVSALMAVKLLWEQHGQWLQ
ncbi:TSUP family transporter [Ferrimonas kyonanensis]|uniref:TSUP family transporter n=1 Tax=Ferrimonas kyonanensis TaxID=364763 RepID=UPI00040041B6|nr:TSUP family transporter [Ferrimonas kyonanensis]